MSTVFLDPHTPLTFPHHICWKALYHCLLLPLEQCHICDIFSPSLILLPRQNEVFPLCSPGTWFILSHCFILSYMIVLFPSTYLQVQGPLISLPLTYCLTHSRHFKIYRSFELEGFLAAELCLVIILQLSSKSYNIQ